MRDYQCPVCHKTLTKKEYEGALGLLQERDAHHAHILNDLKTKLRATKQEAKKARKQGIDYQKARTRQLLQGKERDIQRLKERVKQLQRGKTPQSEGLEFEDKLVKRLKLEFPEDEIKHEGKGGDVLHSVMFARKIAGIIVYECKRTPHWQNGHVEQAYRAKITREAVFVVLVTTADTNRKWKGFDSIKEVLVVSPFAVIPLVRLLRMHIIEMLRAKIPMNARQKIANMLLQHINSMEFRNPLENIARTGMELQSDLKKEVKTHLITWKRRWANYQKINYNASAIQQNIQLVLQGKQTKSLPKPKEQPLPLLPTIVAKKEA